jgi:hypothetical protein
MRLLRFESDSRAENSAQTRFHRTLNRTQGLAGSPILRARRDVIAQDPRAAARRPNGRRYLETGVDSAKKAAGVCPAAWGDRVPERFLIGGHPTLDHSTTTTPLKPDGVYLLTLFFSFELSLLLLAELGLFL